MKLILKNWRQYIKEEVTPAPALHGTLEPWGSKKSGLFPKFPTGALPSYEELGKTTKAEKEELRRAKFEKSQRDTQTKIAADEKATKAKEALAAQQAAVTAELAKKNKEDDYRRENIGVIAGVLSKARTEEGNVSSSAVGTHHGSAKRGRLNDQAALAIAKRLAADPDDPTISDDNKKIVNDLVTKATAAEGETDVATGTTDTDAETTSAPTTSTTDTTEIESDTDTTAEPVDTLTDKNLRDRFASEREERSRQAMNRALDTGEPELPGKLTEIPFDAEFPDREEVFTYEPTEDEDPSGRGVIDISNAFSTDARDEFGHFEVGDIVRSELLFRRHQKAIDDLLSRQKAEPGLPKDLTAEQALEYYKVLVSRDFSYKFTSKRPIKPFFDDKDKSKEAAYREDLENWKIDNVLEGHYYPQDVQVVDNLKILLRRLISKQGILKEIVNKVMHELLYSNQLVSEVVGSSVMGTLGGRKESETATYKYKPTSAYFPPKTKKTSAAATKTAKKSDVPEPSLKSLVDKRRRRLQASKSEKVATRAKSRDAAPHGDALKGLEKKGQDISAPHADVAKATAKVAGKSAAARKQAAEKAKKEAWETGESTYTGGPITKALQRAFGNKRQKEKGALPKEKAQGPGRKHGGEGAMAAATVDKAKPQVKTYLHSADTPVIYRKKEKGPPVKKVSDYPEHEQAGIKRQRTGQMLRTNPKYAPYVRDNAGEVVYGDDGRPEREKLKGKQIKYSDEEMMTSKERRQAQEKKRRQAQVGQDLDTAMEVDPMAVSKEDQATLDYGNELSDEDLAKQIGTMQTSGVTQDGARQLGLYKGIQVNRQLKKDIAAGRGDTLAAKKVRQKQQDKLLGTARTLPKWGAMLPKVSSKELKKQGASSNEISRARAREKTVVSLMQRDTARQAKRQAKPGKADPKLDKAWRQNLERRVKKRKATAQASAQQTSAEKSLRARGAAPMREEVLREIIEKSISKVLQSNQ